MNKKCLLISAAFAVAITFIACGDDSSTSASETKSQSSEVKSFDDLPKCKSKNEGDTIFVKADDASYVCEAREWVLVEDENGEDDNDLSSSSENESSSSFDKSKYDEVKTKDDLDACTTKNKGDSVYVTKEDAVFTCENKKWVEVVIENEVDEPKYEEFKTIKDLPKCDSKTKGDSVYVTKEDAVYTCENKEWVEVKEESDDKDSGKKNKDDDDDDDDDVSSNSKKDKSSSSEDDEEKSSSSKDEEKSSSSEVTSSSSEVVSSSSENVSSSSISKEELQNSLIAEFGECKEINYGEHKVSTKNNISYECTANGWIQLYCSFYVKGYTATKIQLIKYIKDTFGIELKEAKDLVDEMDFDYYVEIASIRTSNFETLRSDIMTNYGVKDAVCLFDDNGNIQTNFTTFYAYKSTCDSVVKNISLLDFIQDNWKLSLSDANDLTNSFKTADDFVKIGKSNVDISVFKSTFEGYGYDVKILDYDENNNESVYITDPKTLVCPIAE